MDSLARKFGFKYVGDNYILYNRKDGKELASTRSCGTPPDGKNMLHLIYCHLRDNGYSMTAAWLTSEAVVKLIDSR